MPVSDLRRRTTSVLQTVTESGDVVYITQHGRPSVVILDYHAYEELLKAAAGRQPAQPASGQSSMAFLASLAADLGVEDLAENHDHHLYGTNDLNETAVR